MKNHMENTDELFKKCMQRKTNQMIKGRDVFTCAQSKFVFYCNCFVDDSKKGSRW